MSETANRSVLYLAIDGMTDPLGQSQVLPYLTGLAEAGYRIAIVSCEKPGNFSVNRDTVSAICEQAGIRWEPIEYRSRLPVISALSNIRRMRRKAEALHARTPFDLVHCRSYLPMFSGVYLKRKFGIPLLFDMRGFWPDERVDGGLWNLKNPMWKAVYHFFKRKEREFLRASDHVITLTRTAEREVRDRGWVPESTPVTVIPCCADLHHFDYHRLEASDLKTVRRELDLEDDDQVMTYLGSLGTFYNIDDMMAFYSAAEQHRPGLKFLVITRSPEHFVWDAAAKAGIDPDNIRVTGASREEVPKYLTLSTFSLVFYKENFSRKGCSPTKLGELMGLGIPVVCSPKIGDTTEIVRQSRCGVVLESLAAHGIHRAVDEMETFLRDGVNKAAIRESAKRCFSLSDGIAAYENVYSDLVSAS